jgi:hypothetical protein
MALSFLVPLPSFVFIDQDFGASLLPNNRAHHPGLFKPWPSDRHLGSFTDHKHRVELNPISCGALELFDRNQVTL